MIDLDQRLAAALQRGIAENDWNRARTEVGLALAACPSSAKALLAFGVCQFHIRDFTGAIATLERAASAARRSSAEGAAPWGSIYLFRALAYAARRLPQAARADFELLRQLDPSPIHWERFAAVLKPDELTRARIAADGAGLIESATGTDEPN